MKKNTAMLTALILGVNCCLPSMAAKAEEKSGEAVNALTDIGTGKMIGNNGGSILQENLGFGDFQKDILDNHDLMSKYQAVAERNESDANQETMKADSKEAEENDEKTLSGDGEEASQEADKESEEGTKNPQDRGGKKADGKESAEMKELQMPQKLEVTIDPWEVDGKGQIYSEQYVIKNTGEKTGILTLSHLTCRPQEKSGVVIRTERDGIHEDGRKSIYMEMIFGTGERIALSEEGREYEAELKPGEEITLEFGGEVNESASESWESGDVTVGVVYSWEEKEDRSEVSGDIGRIDEEISDSDRQETGNADKSGDVSGDISGDVSGDVSGDMAEDISGNRSGDVSENESGKPEESGDAAEDPEKPEGAEKPNVSGNAAIADPDNHEKEKSETIDLGLSKEAEMKADSWVADKNGETASVRYALRNTAEVPGTIILSDIVYQVSDESEAILRLNPRQEGKPENTEPQADEVKLELVLEDKEKLKDKEKSETGPESQEISGYKLELEPGEEVVVCLFIRLNGKLPEEWKAEESVLTVGYSWVLEKEASGL